MKKRAKVHLLPTDKTDGTLWKTTSEQLIHTHVSGEYKEKYQPFNLYITTDDEIKKGDYFYNNIDDEVYGPAEGHEILKDHDFKVIATTDPKLHSTRLKDCPINPEDNMVSVRGVSKPPKSFIEEYCKAGGIDEVNVEYGLFHDGNFKDDDETHAFKAIRKPRVNLHNEIIIHPVKDSWTVEDLPDLLNRFCKDHSLHRGLQITDGMIREWLEKQ
jgi:hypothetical protein